MFKYEPNVLFVIKVFDFKPPFSLLSKVLISTCTSVAIICLKFFLYKKNNAIYTQFCLDWPTSWESRVIHNNTYCSSNHLCGIFVHRLVSSDCARVHIRH